MMKPSILIVMALLLVLSGCTKKEPQQDDVLRIGFSAAPEIFLQERWERDIRIFTSTARDLGAEVILAKSPGNPLDQNAQILFLLKQDIDVLVVIPQDKELIGGIVKKVMDKQIPVLAYDRPVMGVPITGYISFDNRQVGRLMAQGLIGEVPQGNYLILNGSIHDNNSFEVNQGVHEELDPLVAQGDIIIIREIWLDEWSYDEALEKIGQVMSGSEVIDAISAPNDNMAQAAIRLLAEQRLAGEVPVVGQDADLGACQSIVEGTQLMTVYKPIYKLAVHAAELAVDIALGQQTEPDSFLDNGSGVDIPFYVESPIAVYKDDMDEVIIADGFHSKEDVYRTGLVQN